MKNFKNLLFAAISIVFFFGCDDNNGTNPEISSSSECDPNITDCLPPPPEGAACAPTPNVIEAGSATTWVTAGIQEGSHIYWYFPGGTPINAEGATAPITYTEPGIFEAYASIDGSAPLLCPPVEVIPGSQIQSSSSVIFIQSSSSAIFTQSSSSVFIFSSSSLIRSSSSAISSSSQVRSSSSSQGAWNTYPQLQQGGSGVSKGWTSRYWDGCKPSCSWSGKNQSIPGSICKTCDRNNNPIPAIDENRSSCDGGNSYTCWDMTPFVDPGNPNLAYAFAASPTDRCGKCYQIQFDGGFEHGTAYGTHAAIRGKTLIVMTSNMGGDVGNGQFDVLIPGGGLGIFDSFSGQIGKSKGDLGAQYGGLLADCETQLNWAEGSLNQYQTCLRNKCNQVFNNSSQKQLKDGCNFYADWFMAANNPTMLYKEVQCPQQLINKYRE